MGEPGIGQRLEAQQLPVTEESVPCAICQGRSFELLHHRCPDRLHGCPGLFDVVRCRACGLVQTNPRPTRGAIGQYYPQSYVAFAQPQRRRAWLVRFLKQALQLPYTIRYGSISNPLPTEANQNRVLDIGCGSGLLLGAMSRLGWDVWGIEPDESAARSVVRSLGLSSERIFVGGAEVAQFPAGSFDLVTMSHVLEHIHDPTLVLRNVHRWLRPNGRLRIWVPNVESLESSVFGRYWFGLDVPRHLYHFDPATLYRLLGDCGFAIERLVPQFQASSLSGSLSFILGHVLRRPGPVRNLRALYCMTLPLGAALVSLGSSGAIDVTAHKRDR